MADAKLIQAKDQIIDAKNKSIEAKDFKITESRYFCDRFFGNPLTEKSAKITRPLMPSAAPIRPRHRVSTQQGDRNFGSSILDAVSRCLAGFLRFASKTRKALRLSETKNLHSASAPFPRFSASASIWIICRCNGWNKSPPAMASSCPAPRWPIGSAASVWPCSPWPNA